MIKIPLSQKEELIALRYKVNAIIITSISEKYMKSN